MILLRKWANRFVSDLIFIGWNLLPHTEARLSWRLSKIWNFLLLHVEDVCSVLSEKWTRWRLHFSQFYEPKSYDIDTACLVKSRMHKISNQTRVFTLKRVWWEIYIPNCDWKKGKQISPNNEPKMQTWIKIWSPFNS